MLSFELEILDLLSQRVIILHDAREPGKLSTYENMEDLTVSDFKLVYTFMFMFVGHFGTYVYISHIHDSSRLQCLKCKQQAAVSA